MVLPVRHASDGVGWRLSRSGASDFTVLDVERRVEGLKTQAKVAAQMQRDLQDEIDVRTLRSNLPDKEPTKAVDPKRPNIFWDGDEIVTRVAIVTITVRGSGYQIAIRVA